VVGGVSTVVVEVEDQERAARLFWTETMGFEVAQDAAYGEEPRPAAPDPSLPTSNVAFYAEDLQRTHAELTARGVEFPQPPVQQPLPPRWRPPGRRSDPPPPKPPRRPDRHAAGRPVSQGSPERRVQLTDQFSDPPTATWGDRVAPQDVHHDRMRKDP
jgi:lactoylglutathione lyase